MSEWKLDARTSGDILQKIGETAADYTPEWNFDPEHPDIGYALAQVYADMLEGTLKQLNRVGYKYQLALFNSLGAGLHEAVPAEGHAVFQMSSGAPEGTGVPAYAGMTAELPEGGITRYETQEDLYVTPARPVCFYLTDGEKDRICHLAEGLPQEMSGPLVLFGEKGDNLQSHELYLTHEEVFWIRGDACLELSFFIRKGRLLDDRILERMADPEAVRITYFSEDGWKEFHRTEAVSGRLVLWKDREQPPFAKAGPDNQAVHMVRFQNLDIRRMEPFRAEEIRIRSRGERLKPESVYGGSAECGEGEYFPFGEQLRLYEEIYFGSREALGKRSAQITLRFQMDFVKVPLESGTEKSPIEWKWIMKRSEFRPDPEYDVTIEEVIWEYFNGSGWSRLFPGKEYSDVFSPGTYALGQQKTICFRCPADMTSILVNSCDTCYIRARILKINNLYKLQGNYVTPVISEAEFSYAYGEPGKLPETVCLRDNLEERMLKGSGFRADGRGQRIFAGIEEQEKVLYLGFETPPAGAPVRMLWQFQERILKGQGSISWEYYGEKGFRGMNLADETGNLTRTGLVTFVGAGDLKKRRLFGRELYWIRLRDESGYYSDRREEMHYPVLQALYMNAVEIRHMEQEETEHFTLDRYEEDCSFTLMRGSLSSIKVQVLEGREEEAAWVTWKETKELGDANPEDRVYQVDRAGGVVSFGNGVHGQVPPFGREEGIRIHYKCGGGKAGNAGPGQIRRLNQTYGFVTGVYNPQGLRGGLDQETPKEALRRCGAALRHRGRAVTAGDYEALAREACRALTKVRCFGGRNAEGVRESGAVTLVACAEDGGVDSEALVRFFRDRMEPGILERGQFAVIPPKFAEVQVHVKVQAAGFQDIFQVRQSVQERIRSFLDPLKGHFNGEGWNIGQFPRAIQIQNVLKEIPQIVRIEKVYLMAFVSGPGGRQEAEPQTIASHPYVLPVSGEHEVLVSVAGP